MAHRGRHFVVTASHVLRDRIRSGDLVIVSRDAAVRLNQRYFRSQNEDTYDVGFIRLTDEQRAILQDITFVSSEDLDLSDEAAEAPHYFVGYRSDDNEPEGIPTRLTAGWSVYAVRSAPSETYQERQLSNENRLLLKFDCRNLFDPNPVDLEPAPEGMSGAGVWRLMPYAEDDQLTAIVEAHSDSGNLIYAARLRPLVQALDDHVTGQIS